MSARRGPVQEAGRILHELRGRLEASRGKQAVGHGPEQRPNDHLVPAQLRRGESSVRSDPRQLDLAELAEHQSGTLVGHGEQAVRFLAHVTGAGPGREQHVGQERWELPGGESVPGVLVGVPDFAHIGAERCQRRRFAGVRRPDERGELSVVHERFAESGQGAPAAVLRPLQQGRLTDQIADGHVERVGERPDHREPVQLDAVVLRLAEPVGRAANQPSQYVLGQTTAMAVPGNTLAGR